MRLFTFFVLSFAACFASGQWPNTQGKWYSVSTEDGVQIENSFPKGGPFKGKVEDVYQPSYLVFFSRMKNENKEAIFLTIDFPGNATAIPNAPGTFMRLFLPPDLMTLSKQKEFSYGLSEFDPLKPSTKYHKALAPNEEFLFYVVAFFYQTEDGEWSQERGGNRAELVTKGGELFYNLRPQVNEIPVGKISWSK